MKVLDARAAALEIRGDMDQPSAEDRHIEKFVVQVLDALGMEHTLANAGMVVRALHRHDIQPHQFVEFPKAITIKVVDPVKYGDDKEHDENYIVYNAQDEYALLHREEKPEPEAVNEPAAGEKPEPAEGEKSEPEVKRPPGTRLPPKRA